MHPERRRGIALAFGGMLAVSTDSFFIRWADIDGFDVTFWVGVFTSTVLLAGVRVIQRIDPIATFRRGGWPMWLASGLQAGSTSTFVLAVTKTSVSNVVVIIAAAPLVAALMSALWLRERTSPRVWSAIVLVMVGIVIVVSGSWGGGQVEGDLLAVAAITQFGVSLVVLRRHPEISRMVMVGFAGIGMALIAVIPGDLWGHSAETWLALVLMGAVFGPLARVTIAAAPRYLPAAEVGLFTPVETVAASLWAYLFFSETPPGATYLGGVVVVAAVLWGTWQPRTAPA